MVFGSFFGVGSLDCARAFVNVCLGLDLGLTFRLVGADLRCGISNI